MCILDRVQVRVQNLEEHQLTSRAQRTEIDQNVNKMSVFTEVWTELIQKSAFNTETIFKSRQVLLPFCDKPPPG